MLRTLSFPDPKLRYVGVRLCSDLPLCDRDFVRENGSWVFRLENAQLARLEYQLELQDQDGNTTVVCEPANPDRAPGVFGEKSVVRAPGYRKPAWLDEQRTTGTYHELQTRLLGQALALTIWSPADGELPLLLAHDGPEYDELAALTQYAAAMVEAETLPPFRVALLPPGDRNNWYSASATYGRALTTRILPAIRANVPVSGRPFGIGASLGALAMLQAQRTWPGTFAGLFLQSGSFFVPRFDRHESGFPRFARVTRFVTSVIRAQSHPDPVPVALTCGAEEENIHNNRLMASSLAAQGYQASLHEVPDLHNYRGWRDAFDPHLTNLLVRVWSAT